MVTQHSHRISQFTAIGGYPTPVAISPMVFGGEKANAACIAQGTNRFTLIASAESLGAVADQAQLMLLGQLQQRRQRRRLPKQVHGQYRPRALGDGGRSGLRSEEHTSELQSR